MDSLAADMGLTLDHADFRRVARRDVNNFIAISPNGGIKAKGAYGRDPTNLAKKAVNRVVVSAVQQYFIDDTPVAETIGACHDIRQFVDYFNCTKQCTIGDDQGGRHGGIARWYIGTAGVHLDKIKLTDGKTTQLVERGARAIRDLPDTFPNDVDHQHYMAMADALVQAITEPELRITHTIPMDELSREQLELHRRNQDTNTADPLRCRAIDLERAHADIAAVFKGNRFDSHKSVLLRLWLGGCGTLTAGDLLWVALELDAAGGYFTGRQARTLKRMVEWIGREIVAFPLPRTTAQHVTRAMTWAGENVEPLKRKRPMRHRDIFDSMFISAKTLSDYARLANDYKLACAICAVGVKHAAMPEADFIVMLIDQIKTYFKPEDIKPDETI